MSMVCGLDLHRQQITFDAMDTASGEVWRGRVWQPDRDRVRRWLRHDVARRANGQPVALAVEGCTGWREWRERVRLYKSLVDQRLVWTQRIHAELFQHGVAVPEAQIRSAATRARLAGDDVTLTPAARQRVRVGYAMIDASDAEASPLKEQLQRFGVRQPACRALVEHHYGIGGLLAVAVWSELGDCRRFTRSGQVVRHTGLDVTVDASDLRRAGGFLSRQGPATLRWALFEAAHNGSRSGSPDHAYYSAVKERHDGKLAAISVARQFARRCYHILRNLDTDVVYAMPPSA